MIDTMEKQASGLFYAVRLPVLAKYSGQLCVVVAALTVLPLIVALINNEPGIALRYALIIATLAGGGWFLGRINAPEKVQVNEAMVIAALIFLITPLMMSFAMMGSGLTFSDALFEAVSGATTTGLSTVTNLEEMPATFLFARAWMQWYGGLGIVVLSLALLFRPGSAARKLAVNEANEDDLVGGTKSFARHVLVVYVILTGVGILMLTLAGVGPFDALTYTMTAISTAGFAPSDASLAALEGRTAPVLVILICVLGALPFSIYYGILKNGRRPATDFLQLRWFLIAGGIGVLLLAAVFVKIQGESPGDAFYHASILAFSAQSTAGFSSMDLEELHPASKLVLILCMTVGGSMGSTAGGIKILRLLIVISLLWVIIQRICASKHAVAPFRIAGQRMEDTRIQEALLIVLLFGGVVITSWLAFLMMGYDPIDSLFEVVSATGTVGLSAGVTDSGMPVVLKGVLCVNMLLGRLEIIAWLVFIYPKTWIARRL